MTDKTLIVVYNQKTKKYSEKNSDFFSIEEITFIKEMALYSEVNVIFIEGELSFINNINNYFPSEIVVLNLTRRGSRRSQKCAVTALCDLKSIPTIGSSVLTMGLCRSKDYLEPLLEIIGVQYPHVAKNISELSEHTHYIVKAVNSAGSIGLDKDSVLQGRHIKLDKFSEDFIIQEYIEGEELEVPFIIESNGNIKILGVYALKIGNTNYFTPDNECLLDCENSDNFNYELNKVDLPNETYQALHKIVCDTVQLLEIENYGRIDFRTKDIHNIDEYFLFDIATSPFFTENSSFLLGCENNVFDLLFSTLPV